MAAGGRGQRCWAYLQAQKTRAVDLAGSRSRDGGSSHPPPKIVYSDGRVEEIASKTDA